ncbi:MAG: DUF1015 family protein [Nitriliruptoraceae bacterium]|nr:DUF1015 family protein [Nitriliruptoraceae bacterium]
MPVLRAFDGFVVRSDVAADVIAPPYDQLSADQRRRHARSNAGSFLEALPVGGRDRDELARIRPRLDAMLRDGPFRALPGPVMAVLTLHEGVHRTRALLADLDLDRSEKVHGHEEVRPPRVEQLVDHLRVVGATSSPVAMVHRPDPALAARLHDATSAPAELDVALPDGVTLQVHLVTDPDEHAALAATAGGCTPWVIADGHHRMAAAQADRAARGEDAAGTLLVALIASDELRVLSFDRRVVGLGPDPLTVVRSVLGELAPAVDPGVRTPQHGSVLLDARTDAGVRQVHPLDLTAWSGPGHLGEVDTARLERGLLTPLREAVAGVRIEPVLADPTRLPARGTLLVRLAPVEVEQILRVASHGLRMPPKTTYLTPKLRSGVVVVRRGSTGRGLGGPHPRT